MPTRDDAPDWLDAPYVRVYSTLAADHPVVWDDPTLLGWYVRLLMVADPLWPGVAPLPRDLTDDVLAVMVDDEHIVELVGRSSYRVRALDRERTDRADGRTAGGRARARQARRDRHGRMLGESAGRMLDDAGDAGPMLDESAGSDAGPMLAVIHDDSRPDVVVEVADDHLLGLLDDAGESAGHQVPKSAGSDVIQHANQPTNQPGDDDDDVGTTTTEASSSSPTRARVRTRGLDSPDARVIDCDDPGSHAQDHVNIPGVGWKCLRCERERASTDPVSFKEKVAKHGGTVW